MSDSEFPRAARPCPECPWRVDTRPGQFSACRYDVLADTTGEPGREAHLGAPMFACHKSPEGREWACAGWLAAVGWEHLGVRIAAIVGRLPVSALEPGDGWPQLHASYAEMVAAKAADHGSAR